VKLLIYEHLCAGGLGERPAPSLLREGCAMLRAVAEDFAAIEGVEAITPVANWFDQPLPSGAKRISAAANFRDVLRGIDAVLAIAPEFDGNLERLCVDAQRAGVRWLGCSADAIRLTADKLALGRWWQQRGVPTPRIVERAAQGRYVRKPRYGAGSQDMQLLDVMSHLNGGEAFLLQEYAPGMAASVSFLCGPSVRTPLQATQQLLSDDGSFRYLGGRLPLPEPMASRATALALRAIDGIEGLGGWVGVDLILGENEAEDRAIEINPRLTTSYVGIRRVARCNLANVWLAFECGEMARLDWTETAIEFRADGTLGEPPSS